MTANQLSVLLFLGQAIISIIGWYLVAKYRSTDKVEKRIDEIDDRIGKVERFRDKTIGWVKGAFNINLNGD